MSQNCSKNNCLQYDTDYSWDTDIQSLGPYVALELHYLLLILSRRRLRVLRLFTPFHVSLSYFSAFTV